MRFIDIGVNLMHRAFDSDREQVLAEAGAAGVSPLIITGTGEGSSAEAADYAARWPGRLYATAGVHPHEAKNGGPSTLDTLRALAGRDCVVAIGECGLDYNRDFSPRDVQREWFEKQLRLAAELGMPLFLHERDAFEDFAALAEKYRGAAGMAVHCFTGAERELDRYLELGCYIGITGWICDERRGSRLGPLLARIPPDRLMLETDAPFLLPRNLAGPGGRPRRSGRNEPQFLVRIAETAARCLGKDTARLAEETRANACRFFGIKPG